MLEREFNNLLALGTDRKMDDVSAPWLGAWGFVLVGSLGCVGGWPEGERGDGEDLGWRGRARPRSSVEKTPSSHHGLLQPCPNHTGQVPQDRLPGTSDLVFGSQTRPQGCRQASPARSLLPLRSGVLRAGRCRGPEVGVRR